MKHQQSEFIRWHRRSSSSSRSWPSCEVWRWLRSLVMGQSRGQAAARLHVIWQWQLEERQTYTFQVDDHAANNCDFYRPVWRSHLNCQTKAEYHFDECTWMAGGSLDSHQTAKGKVLHTKNEIVHQIHCYQTDHYNRSRSTVLSIIRLINSGRWLRLRLRVWQLMMLPKLMLFGVTLDSLLTTSILAYFLCHFKPKEFLYCYWVAFFWLCFVCSLQFLSFFLEYSLFWLVFSFCLAGVRNASYKLFAASKLKKTPF